MKTKRLKIIFIILLLIVFLFSTCDDFSLYEMLGKTELQLSPELIVLQTNSQSQFAASGGEPPYLFSLYSGLGFVDSMTGIYTAPDSMTNDIIEVTDNDQTAATSIAVVLDRLVLSPSPVTIYMGDSITFTAAGGKNPRTFSIISGSGELTDIIDGTLQSTVTYTAPGAGGSALLQVTDEYDNIVKALITITETNELLINPTSAVVSINGTVDFIASGGNPSSYVFSVFSGNGTIVDPNVNPATYIAPSSPEDAVIRVTDGNSDTADAEITVIAGDPLQISPSSLELVIDTSYTFTASGGQGLYIFTIESGGGTLTPDTAASVIFTAPSTGNDKTVLTVTDELGSTSSATIKTRKK